jgi:hypothetical protein
MGPNVQAYVGGTLPKCLFLLLLLTLIISPVYATVTKTIDSPDIAIYNRTMTLVSDGSTPIELWEAAIGLGLILILISFCSRLFENGEEGLVSIMAWLPIAYALYTSFTIDIITGSGVTSQCLGTSAEYVLMESHSIYQFTVPATFLFILLIFAIGNTYRIYAQQRRLRRDSQITGEEQGDLLEQ